ncbi:sensor histidine kinase [Mucilaginibacter xinganensis]|uniref:histidine kinase n=1 Tax=Mucilaginibacter xinganensis TaxID=1234841 RepID=A0A223P338_9SPHI|nr:7TM diverse intracellular signaling domain-containing protein [Mucilaginibacter xinganensis]ASU36460.1 histidine kinase [Mucilaginibacter xinganensis]
MCKNFLRLLIGCCFLLLNNRAFADVIINNAEGRVMIGRQISVLQINKELSLKDVLSSKDFKRCDKDVPNLGFSAFSTWIRFTVTNQTKYPDLLLDLAYPILDEVELFTPDSQNQYHGILMGEIKNFDTRKYKQPDYIFDLDIPYSTTKTYYLRIKSSEQLILPVSVNQKNDLWQFLSRENQLSGIFFGAVLIMFLYNLFIFFTVRDKSYIYYVIYVASVGLTQLGIKGFAFQYLWGNSPAFELKSVIVFACLGAIAATLFTRSFLLTRQRARRFDIVLIIVIILQAIALLITLAGKVQAGFQLMQLSTTLFAFSILIASAIVMLKGYRPAKYVFFSWSVLLIGAVIFALKDNGVLPYNTFTGYSMQAASVIEMALLSFGLADRINILKREKAESQAEALEIARENERIIREQNVMLELKVNERTAELSESNFELNKILTDLKQTQSQLVESEKMASLGQLTAGIAHEINNPINFVTSNIKPLNRDIEIMFEAFSVIENVSLSDATATDKQKQINDYKEELDFDYLTLEIRQLINGINEGATRTAEIVKSLRIFSRLDEDDLKKADINEGLESTMIIANNMLHNKIKIIKEYGILPKIECYAGKLNQVFLNIIANAVYAVHKKFGENEGGEITISTSHDDKNVYVKIADNGAGMDAQTQKRVFEPFFTTKDVGEGTGLGMSIAYNTIKKHNGIISVDSIEGKRTEFVLQIPINFAAVG